MNKQIQEFNKENTNKEYILYGRKENEADYMESVLAECKTLEELDNATYKALEDGYITRVMIYEKFSMPNFANTINKFR